MLKQTEFKIDRLPNREFRVGKITVPEILAIQTQIDFDDLNKTTQLFSFILERTEVKIEDSWVAVKVRGKDQYFPVNLQDDLIAMREIVMKFISDIIIPLFRTSVE